jgi:hypothetical protein
MVVPDLFKEEGKRRAAPSVLMVVCIGMKCICRTLGYTVDDIHNCIIPMGFRQFDYEVNIDHVLWCLRCLRRVELTNRSLTLHFHPVAQITGPDIDTNVAGHLGPPAVVGYELYGLEAACMSGNAHIMVLLNNTTPQFSVFGDIDLTMEHD